MKSLINLINKPKKELSDNFTRIVKANQHNIYMLALRIVGSESDAEDITQEVFIKFYKSYGNFRGESKVSTLLYRIAYNHAIDFMRKSRKRLVTTQLQDSMTHSDNQDVNNEEKMQMLDKAISQLEVEERAIITLFYKEDKSLEDISKITSLSIGNVKVKLHRIRKKLYKSIGENYYE